jgi:hypothetical protein
MASWVPGRCSEVLPWIVKTRVARSRDTEKASPWLQSQAYLFYSSGDCRSKRQVLFDPMGSWRFLVQFHGKSNPLVPGTPVICAFLKVLLRRSSLFHFLHPWIPFLRRILQSELWVPKARFLAEVLLWGDLLCLILWVARTSVDMGWPNLLMSDAMVMMAADYCRGKLGVTDKLSSLEMVVCNLLIPKWNNRSH